MYPYLFRAPPTLYIFPFTEPALTYVVGYCSLRCPLTPFQVSTQPLPFLVPRWMVLHVQLAVSLADGWFVRRAILLR